MSVSRRDFLKLLSVLSASMLGANARSMRGLGAVGDKPNVLVFLFDTLSARHVSLYGYGRDTTPHLKRFAERAMVFHRHYSGGNFTVPGTTSLLTGVYPWRHRAFHFHGLPIPEYLEKNVFSLMVPEYEEVQAFSQNHLVNYLIQSLSQGRAIQDLDSLHEAALYSENLWTSELFKNDYVVEQRVEYLYRELELGFPISPLLAEFANLVFKRNAAAASEAFKEEYPNGLPHNPPYVFSVEDTHNWVIERCGSLGAPFFGYFHMMPPHQPYRPSAEFLGAFEDDFKPVEKPQHFFTDEWPQEALDFKRQQYDEYILNVDAEFGRVIDRLESQGALDDTIVVFTSDHGELFERGIWAHTTYTLYEPIIHIPLLVRMPGQSERQDIHTPNSNIDVLPTLLHLCGMEIPAWVEGEVLPPWKAADESRPVFSMDAKVNSSYRPMEETTVAMILGDYKLVYYRGYEDFEEQYELYDLAEDPEELNDLWGTAEVGEEMAAMLLAKLGEADIFAG